jgi:hypothetical protein
MTLVPPVEEQIRKRYQEKLLQGKISATAKQEILEMAVQEMNKVDKMDKVNFEAKGK